MGLAAHVDEGPLRWASLPAPWLLTLLVIVGFLWIRALYGRERGRASRAARFGLACLRTLVLLCVVLVLGAPYRQEETRAVEKSHLVVLVDSSASMNVKDSYDPAAREALLQAAFPSGPRPKDLSGTSRAELVQRVLAPAGEALLRKWAKRFVLHVFAFDADWRSLGSTQTRGPAGTFRPQGTQPAAGDPVGAIGEALRGLVSDGGHTRLGAVLRNVANEFARRQDQHLAGVVLISDGRDTSDGEPPLQVLTALGPVREKLHVSAIGLGNPASGKNLWVERIRAKDVVLVDDNVVFETALRHTGFGDHRGPVDVHMDIVKVADEQGTPLVPPQPYSARLPRSLQDGLALTVKHLAPESQPTPIRMRAPFRDTGTFRVSIRARFRDPEDRRLDSVKEDDVRSREIRVKDQRIKVLYVDDLPRHDWRFLSNYLTREPGKAYEGTTEGARSRFEVHVLLQSADPAFRQPASVGLTPLHRFPNNRRELFDYDVLILGDVDWDRLDPDSPQGSKHALELIADFVEEGGGLALQAGVDYHDPTDLIGTPLAPLVPLNIRSQDKTASDRFDQPFHIQLTRAGAAHPIFAVVPGPHGGIATPDEIKATWAGATTLSEDWIWYWLYRAPGGLRPGAVDLARVKPMGDARGLLDQRGEPLVVFATMPYGKGQVFWSSLDTISRIRRAQRDRIYGAFWEQVIRYLATYRLLGGNARYKIFTDKDSYFVGDTAQVTITALDDKYEPLTDPTLEGVRVEIGDDPITAETVVLQGDAAPKSQAADGQPGTYRLLLPLTKKGLVRIWIDAAARGAEHATKERAEKRFEVTYRTREDILKIPDHRTLLDIVRATNQGLAQPRVYSLADLGDVVAGIQARPRERVLDRRERTQWDRTWVLLLITGLLALEWLWRKRLQMI
jgi:uncharacterized membrane protein